MAPVYRFVFFPPNPLETREWHPLPPTAQACTASLFEDATGKRQTFYLGRIPEKTAEGIQRAVGELESATQYGHTPADFARRLD